MSLTDPARGVARATLTALAVLAWATASAAGAPERPNVLIFVADEASRWIGERDASEQSFLDVPFSGDDGGVTCPLGGAPLRAQCAG